jgi:tetratricopeptide (TPR) repeat protein
MYNSGNSTDAEAHYNLAQAYKEKGDLAEAEKSYQAAVRVDPKYAQAYYNYGNLLANQKRYPAAISAYKSALAADGGMEKAYYNMALAYMNTQQYPEALQAYRSFVKAAEGKPALKGQVEQVKTDIIPQLEQTIQGQ